MESSHEVEDAESGDHRPRVARQRRARMRQRLLQSVLASYDAAPLGSLPTVETVIADAGVSKATFYKYFTSIDEAGQILGQEMAADMVRTLKALYSPEHAPEFRMTASMLVFILRSVREPLWADFVSRADVVGAEGEIRKGFELHIKGARDTGFLQYSSPAAAMAIAIGVLQQTMRDASRMPADDVAGFAREVIVLALRGLGADPDAAGSLFDSAFVYMRDAAPERLPTWQESLANLEASS